MMIIIIIIIINQIKETIKYHENKRIKQKNNLKKSLYSGIKKYFPQKGRIFYIHTEGKLLPSISTLWKKFFPLN